MNFDKNPKVLKNNILNNLVCIVGASGAIGKRMFHFFLNNLPNYQIEGTFYEKNTNNFIQLNIHDYEAVEIYIKTRRPYVIVWLSGTKDVIKCQKDNDYAFKMNCTALEGLIKIIVKESPLTKVIYLSSDYVFDGTKGYYNEYDTCNPLTNYGKSKLKAEQLLINSSVDYLITRVSAVIIKGEGFIGWLTNQIKEKNLINLYSNTYFSPTPIDYLNNSIAMLIQLGTWEKRIVHIAGPRMSRFDFGIKIASHLGVDSSFFVNDTADFENTTFQSDISLIPSIELEQISKDIWADFFKEISND